MAVDCGHCVGGVTGKILAAGTRYDPKPHRENSGLAHKPAPEKYIICESLRMRQRLCVHPLGPITFVLGKLFEEFFFSMERRSTFQKADSRGIIWGNMWRG